MQYRVLGLYALLGSSTTSTHKVGYNAAQKFCKELTKHNYNLFFSFRCLWAYPKPPIDKRHISLLWCDKWTKCNILCGSSYTSALYCSRYWRSNGESIINSLFTTMFSYNFLISYTYTRIERLLRQNVLEIPTQCRSFCSVLNLRNRRKWSDL